MGKRILVTSTDLMMVQFLLPHIRNLAENGYIVEIACSDVGARMEEIQNKIGDCVKKVHTVNLHRSPINLGNFKGFGEMKHIIEQGHYDIIWTNEPVMGVVTRLAVKKARKRGTKILYMVHGFHFFDGAPKLNWLVYYPIEKSISRITDIIVTINKEDFSRAKRMHTKTVKYVHGIGVNTERLQKSNEQKDIRKELGLLDNDFLVLSVGELNKNKNQRIIIEALGCLKDNSIHYILCGKGNQFKELKRIAKERNIEKNVHFLGYRRDVVDICSQVDVFAFPTYREGLGLAALEAMYCGLPLITSNSRGPIDFMHNGKNGYICNPDDVNAFANAIENLKSNKLLRKKMGELNRKIVKPFCLEEVKEEILSLINDI